MKNILLTGDAFGVRRQSEAATALWMTRRLETKTIQSGVALRLPSPFKMK